MKPDRRQKRKGPWRVALCFGWWRWFWLCAAACGRRTGGSRTRNRPEWSDLPPSTLRAGAVSPAAQRFPRQRYLLIFFFNQSINHYNGFYHLTLSHNSEFDVVFFSRLPVVLDALNDHVENFPWSYNCWEFNGLSSTPLFWYGLDWIRPGFVSNGSASTAFQKNAQPEADSCVRVIRASCRPGSRVRRAVERRGPARRFWPAAASPDCPSASEVAWPSTAVPRTGSLQTENETEISGRVSFLAPSTLSFGVPLRPTTKWKETHFLFRWATEYWRPVASRRRDPKRRQKCSPGNYSSTCVEWVENLVTGCPNWTWLTVEMNLIPCFQQVLKLTSA